jgi:phosphatidylserine/phosphatidylglycerophosphate/cardiolipin synthase-like enzyme
VASGPVLSDFHKAFEQMWNEVKGRSVVRLTGNRLTADSHTSSMPTLPSRTVTGATGTLHMQSVRTLPQMNFSSSGSMVLPTNRPLSYAPNGLFEIQTVWEKALRAADNYIYIEDQAFTSPDIFDRINEVVTTRENLRVILLTGQPDPNDAPNSLFAKLFALAVNNHLLRNIPAGSPILNRIGVFSHRNKTIHTKATLVDDLWALVGSANSMQRSLFTDFEHSIAYMDEQGQAVPRHRAALWQPHIGSNISALNTAIAAWFAIPFQGTPGARQIDRLRLPLTPVTLTPQEQALHTEVMDVDSRQTWGLGLVRAMMSSGAGALSGPGGGVPGSGGGAPGSGDGN